MRNSKNLVGTIINNLTIISYFSYNKRQYFETKCFCGKIFRARAESIKKGTTKSCGCSRGKFQSEKVRLPNNLAMILFIYRSYKANAKKRNLLFDLDIEDFKKLIFDNCYYCGQSPTPSTFFLNGKNRMPRELIYNGVDRMHNQYGYTIDNCCSCCSLCNRAKLNESLDDFNQWIKRLVLFNKNLIDNAK